MECGAGYVPEVRKRVPKPLFLCLENRMNFTKMLCKILNRWIKRKDGTTAIEFSLLAIPYVMLTIGIIELSIMYTAGSLLEGATSSAARLVRTGQIQQSGVAQPEEAFRDAMCSYATVLIRCEDIVIEALPLNSFADAEAMQPQYDAEGNMISQGFSIGGSNDRVLIRVSYRYSMMTPFIGPLLVGPANSRLFMSTIVLQSEPYEFEES